MDKIKNIVIVNDFDYTQGGASKVAIDTANILVNSDKNLNIYYFSACHSNSTNLDKKVINICTNQGEALKDKNKIRGFFNGLYNFKAKKQLKKLLLTLNKEETIVHVHGWTKALSSSVFDIAFKLKYKVVLTMHDYFTACPNGGYFNYKENKICHLKPLSLKCIKCNCDSRNYFFKLYRLLRQFIQNKIVKLNDRLTDVISISDFSKKILKKTLSAKTRIHRVYNPIDLDDDYKKIDYKNNKYFLYVGRVSPEKGVDIFCKAISELKIEGVVVGDGSDLEKLKLEYPNIVYVGWKSSSEVKEFMKGAKALIFPSRLYETMGLTVVEAQSVGLPVFVANNTAGIEFVEDDNYIFNNVDDLKVKLLNFQNSDFKFIKKDLFSIASYLENVLKVYMEMIK